MTKKLPRQVLHCPTCGKDLRRYDHGADGVTFRHGKNAVCKTRVEFIGNGWWSVLAGYVPPAEALASHNRAARCR